MAYAPKIATISHLNTSCFQVAALFLLGIGRNLEGFPYFLESSTMLFPLLTALGLECCARAFSLVAASGSSSLLVVCRASLCRGFSCCRPWALGCVGFSSCSLRVQLPCDMESSWIRDQIHVPCIGRHILTTGPSGMSSTMHLKVYLCIVIYPVSRYSAMGVFSKISSVLQCQQISHK